MWVNSGTGVYVGFGCGRFLSVNDGKQICG